MESVLDLNFKPHVSEHVQTINKSKLLAFSFRNVKVQSVCTKPKIGIGVPFFISSNYTFLIWKPFMVRFNIKTIT